jgi:competence protein ComEA
VTGPAGTGGALAVLRDRLLIGPSQLAVLAMLVLGGLLVAGWWLLRGSPAEVQQVSVTRASPLVTPAGVDAAAADGVPDAGVAVVASARPGSTVVVDVEGRVRHPGIVVLAAGSRVVDAVRAAGGARPHVDLSGLNLARQLVDGEQILVGVAPPGGVAASAAASPGATVPGALVNLNTADQPTLEGLPEVGPVTAQAIMTWREEHGGFTAVDQLLDVDGIGEATLGRIAPLVTI